VHCHISRLEVTEDVTIQGSLTISVEIDADCTFVVNSSDDEMILGEPAPNAPLYTVGGLATFNVSDGGKLTVKKCKLLASNPGQGETPITWNISDSGSEIELADYSITGQDTIDWNVNMTGGTLDIDRWFKASGDLDISGGTAEIGDTFDVSGDVDLSGGTLQLDYANTITGDMAISGGTLQVYQNFTCDGELTFSAGKMALAANKTAAFTPND